MNQAEVTNNGFRDQMINGNITGIQNAVTSGFGDTALGIAGINQNICQTGNGIVSAVTGAQNAITGQMYNDTIANLERSYNAQTANTQAITGLQSQLAQCLKKISDKAKDFFSFTNYETVGTLVA